MRTCLRRIVLIASGSLVVLTSASAAAQGSAALDGAREALTRYDLGETSPSLRALGDLGSVVARGEPDAAEARVMRALAGAELWTAATLLGDASARDRVASALGVTPDEAPSHLRAELIASAHGVYRTAGEEARELIDVATALTEDAARLRTMAGARRDAAFALFVRAHPDAASLALLGPDTAEPAASSWDESSRRALGALREALAATARAQRAAAAGDPLLSLLESELAQVTATVTAVRLRPRVRIPSAIGVPPAEVGTVLPFDLLVVVTEDAVHFGRAPVVQLDATGALVPALPGDALPAMTTVAVAADLPPVPQPLAEVAATAAALSLSPGATVVLAPTGSVPAHVLTRVLLSLARASVTVSHLGVEHADETLAAIPFRAVRAAEAETPDVRARVRMGAYAVTREHGGDTIFPRVRDASGRLVFDAPGLRAFLSAGRHGTVTLEAMAGVPGSEVVRAVAVAAESGADVSWLLP